ncbi:MbeB family mobilization protein [Lonepinella koalarum]|uniref:MbeB family mobilization protein n=1 Tax=Lonepinella koalarum TaxID=53417 RepID=UPI003F6DAA9C
MATAFQKQSEKTLENTNEIVQNVIKQHETDLKQQLQLASNNLNNAIQAEQKKLIKATVKAWKFPTLILFALMAIMLIVSGGLAWYSKQTYQELQEWQNSMKVAKEVTNGIKLSTCKTKDGSKPCVAIDTDYPEAWGENYKILKLYEPKNKKTN